MKRLLSLLSLTMLSRLALIEAAAQQPASEHYRLAVVDFVSVGTNSKSATANLVGPIVGESTGSASSSAQQISVGFWSAASATTDRLADSLRFEQVLDQTAVHGQVVEFHVSPAGLKGPVTFALVADPATTNVVHAAVEFHAVTDFDAHFRYEPTVDDLEPFNLMIVATGADGKQDYTEFTVTPYPVLPAEEDLVQSSLPLPPPDSRDYVATSSEESAAPEMFNGRLRPTLTVNWVGKKLVVQRGHETQLVETYDRDTEQTANIKRLTVIAEEVEMIDPVRVPGAEVVVFAKSFKAPGLGKPFGDAASVTIITNATEWLQPEALRMMVGHLRDGYLNAFTPERVNGMRQHANNFLTELDAVKTSPRWAALTPEARNEFGQQRDELQTLLWSLERNLDLFGNPAGWVPNLSFEVNFTLFSGEIERAIKTLYLTQWLMDVADGVQARIAGMKQSQAVLFTQVETANSQLGDLQARLPPLQAEAIKLAAAIEDLKGKIVQREEELRREAEAAANAAKKKKSAWKKIASIAGTVLQVFPIGQPVLGAIGTGLSLATTLNKDSFKDPIAIISTISQFGGIAKSFAGLKFPNLVQEANDYVGGILKPLNPASILPPTLPFQPGFMEYVDKVKDFYKNAKASVDKVTELVEKVRGAIRPVEINATDAQALLAKARAENPEFNAPIRTSDQRLNGLLDEVEATFNKQRVLADEITDVIKRMTELNDEITRGILAIDAVNQSLAKANGAFDARTATALKDMERRAHQRLLKYHYYLAKAYEARFLKPYNEPLDLSRFYGQLVALAKLAPNSDGTLTQAQVDVLLGAYREALAKVVARVVEGFNQEGPGVRLSASYKLNTAELDLLNHDQAVSVNFVERCLVPRDREAIEINGISLTMKVMGDGDNDTVRLRLQHPGESKFKRGGKNWLFRHNSLLSSNPFRREHPFRWELEYDSNLNEFRQTAPSLGDTSLLEWLLTQAGMPVNSTNLLLFSRAGLWADLNLTREDQPDILANYKIQEALIKVDYDFRNQSREFAVLDVETVLHPALRPLFVLDKVDRAGRQHGIGRMSRTYSRGAGVVLSTPAVIGSWRFKQWTGCGGRSLPNEILVQATNPKLRLLLDDNVALQAVYENTDTDEDGMDDSWERQHLGGLTGARNGDLDLDQLLNFPEFLVGTLPENRDSDGDGSDDLTELANGTNPLDRNSPFPKLEISIHQSDPDRIRVSWTVAPGRDFPLWISSDLNSTVWETAPVESVGTNRQAIVTVVGNHRILLVSPNVPSISITSPPPEIVVHQ